MSSCLSDDVEIKVITNISEDGSRTRTISIYVGNEEVVYGMDSLELAIQEFDSNYMEAF